MHTDTSLSLPLSVIMSCRLLILFTNKTLRSSVTPSCRNLFHKASGSFLEQTGRGRTSLEILALSTDDRPLAVVKATDILHSLALLHPPMAVHSIVRVCLWVMNRGRQHQSWEGWRSEWVGGITSSLKNWGLFSVRLQRALCLIPSSYYHLLFVPSSSLSLSPRQPLLFLCFMPFFSLSCLILFKSLSHIHSLSLSSPCLSPWSACHWITSPKHLAVETSMLWTIAVSEGYI